MIRMSPLTALSKALSHQVSRQMCAKMMMTSLVMASLAITGCTTNYLTNSTNGTYGVPVTERTIPQRLLDRSIEHTAKINVYGLQQDLQQNSRMSIDSFNSEVLLSAPPHTGVDKILFLKAMRWACARTDSKQMQIPFKIATL